MNILPKKRWHVRTKDNIARVRRDEAEAREKEERRLEKLKLAESEARINFLRRQTGVPEQEQQNGSIQQQDGETVTTESTSLIDWESQHINLFADFKTHTKRTNKELEREKKAEREKYEKKIGYLTYLGQDTNEALKQRSWYEVAPKHFKATSDAEIDKEEKDVYNKYNQDPLTLIKALLPESYTKEPNEEFNSKTPTVPAENTEISCKEEKYLCPRDQKKIKKDKKSKKHKKEKSHKKGKREREKDKIKVSKKSSKIDSTDIKREREENRRVLLERLRKERLQREADERDRQDALLNPAKVKIEPKETKIKQPVRVVQKYNSQFNPNFAKQNIL